MIFEDILLKENKLNAQIGNFPRSNDTAPYTGRRTTALYNEVTVRILTVSYDLGFHMIVYAKLKSSIFNY